MADSLSPRAQEILRRADEQVASLRRARALAGAGPSPAAEGAAPAAEPGDAQALMDRVEQGLTASRAHIDALSEALEAIAGELGVATPAAPPAGPSVADVPAVLAGHAMPPGEPARDAEDEAPASARPSGIAQDAARLVAIEMAVAGDSREIVGRRLRDEFGIADAGSILDDVFGMGSTSASRMPWGT